MAEKSGVLKKTPEKEQTKTKKLVQLDLKSAPVSVRKSIVSEKAAVKKPRTSSGDHTPAHDGSTSDQHVNISGDLHQIQQSLTEIRESMVKKSDVKALVSEILLELKNEIKSEIKQEIVDEMKKDFEESIKNKVKKEFEDKIDEKCKEFETQTKEISEGFNLDFDTLREKLNSQASELRSLNDKLKQCESAAQSAMTLANQNQQYSQKANIKFLNWAEEKNENLRSKLCTILKEAVKMDLDPSDVLAIHRIPGGDGKGPRPVIAKFRNTEVKIAVIKNRSNDKLKKCFTMHDHLTYFNAKLLRNLNGDPRIQSAWYYNGKIFALDEQGRRHRFDILDNVSEKLKRR